VIRAALALPVSLILSAACTPSAPDGTPCANAFECASAACLALDASVRVCARRCARSDECAASQVCGRFDFRARDDGGLPVGPERDIVRVCRAPLAPRCDACGRCERPCDDARECPADARCDTMTLDREGHGRCVVTPPDADVAPLDAARCDGT
jgi:hypothetical protein